jgi:hypothetical protein
VEVAEAIADVTPVNIIPIVISYYNNLVWHLGYISVEQLTDCLSRNDTPGKTSGAQKEVSLCILEVYLSPSVATQNRPFMATLKPAIN